MASLKKTFFFAHILFLILGNRIRFITTKGPVLLQDKYYGYIYNELEKNNPLLCGLYCGKYSVGFAFWGYIFGLESMLTTQTIVQDYFYGYIECGTSLRSLWLVWILFLGISIFCRVNKSHQSARNPPFTSVFDINACIGM